MLFTENMAIFFCFQWRRDVAFAGFEVPIQMDISAEKMIFGVAGIDPQRRDELIKVSRYIIQKSGFGEMVKVLLIHLYL